MSGISAIETAIEKDLAGLTALRDGLGAMAPALAAATDLIAGMEGRLILTGLGKSGHVAAKLAATFSSTGTPAYFLHPAEASHGDLGMVQRTDVILALSWSGETKELSDVLGYAKRHGVPLVAFTRRAESTLAQAADIAVVMPEVREACPHNLAPTTSTLVQMALGDALAIALLDRRGFTEESFHGFHPGGSLGAALKRVDEVMHGAEVLPLIAVERPVIEALAVLSERGFGIVGVTDGGGLAGVITDGDIRRYLAANAEATMKDALHETSAAEVMTRGSVVLEKTTIVGEALSILQARRISAAFVVEAGAPVGLVTMLRLLNSGAA
ncbi:MAG: KpsF/GutQ family sugar-phosphate isomerase [Pseudomonadota bacterium]